MANRYDTPYDFKISNKSFVAPIDVLGKVLAVKQKHYDDNLAMIESIPELAGKIKAIGGHKDIVNSKINTYYSKLLEQAEKNNGDFSNITSNILSIKRQLARDMMPTGTLGVINSYATSMEDWYKTYKNDKDIDLQKLSGVYKLYTSNTYDDLDEYNKTGKSDIIFNPITVPKSMAFIQKELFNMLKEIPEDAYDRVNTYFDKNSGQMVTKNEKVTYRSPDKVNLMAKSFLGGNADISTHLTLDKVLGTNSDVFNVVTNTVKSVLSKKEDKSESRSAIKEGSPLDEKDESSRNFTWLGVRDFAMINPEKNPLEDFFNKKDDAWNGKWENGVKINNDSSWEQRRENMANAFLHHRKADPDMPFNLDFHIAKTQLLKAENPEDLRQIAKRLEPRLANVYKANVNGIPITKGADIHKARIIVENSMRTGNLTDINGRPQPNITLQELEDAHFMQLKPDISAGKSGYGVLTYKNKKPQMLYSLDNSLEAIKADNDYSTWITKGNTKYNPKTGKQESSHNGQTYYTDDLYNHRNDLEWQK